MLKNLFFHEHRYAIEVLDTFKLISKGTKSKRRTKKGKNKGGLFSRLFGSASDPDKEEEQKGGLAKSLSFQGSGVSSTMDSEKMGLRRHDSSFSRSVVLGKPTSKYDHSFHTRKSSD